MLWISPKHLVPETFLPPHLWDIDYKIDVFLARTDGWHLEVADRCINGWLTDGDPSITTNHLGDAVNYIPNSGWAVLQIVFYYFETVAEFKNGHAAFRWRNGERFRWGINDVFPNLQPQNVASDVLWNDFRNGLYHTGISKSRFRIAHSAHTEPVAYDATRDILVIDPHLFIPWLRKHLEDYGQALKNPNEVDLRNRFEEAFDRKYRG